MKPTSFPNLDLPLVDPQTGKITKAWYQLIMSLYLLLGGSDPISTSDLGVQANQMDENFAATIEVENNLEALRRALTMDDALHARLAELQKVLDSIASGNSDDQGARIAELEKRLNDLETLLAFQPHDPHGTMAEQNANAVTVTGGSMDGVTIGAQTPEPATFTTVHATSGNFRGALAVTVQNTTTPVNIGNNYGLYVFRDQNNAGIAVYAADWTGVTSLSNSITGFSLAFNTTANQFQISISSGSTPRTINYTLVQAN